MPSREMFVERYGRWAVVAGASEGLGAAFADALAARGMNLVLIARRSAVLEKTAAAVRDAHGVQVDERVMDLGAPDLPARLREVLDGREIGVGIYNAAYAPIGALATRSLDDLLRVVDVNVRGPLVFAHTLAPAMIERGRGGIVLMSSLVGLSGSPRLATYAATKAFNVVLAESLWSELGAAGVDVLTSCAGAIRTPGLAESARAGGHAPGDPPGTLDPDVVAEKTLRALGRGPRVVPGMVNKMASLVVGRWLPRTTAVSIMARSTKDLA